MALTRSNYRRGYCKGPRKWQELLLLLLEPVLGILFQVNNSKILSRLGWPSTRGCLEQVVSQAHEEKVPLLVSSLWSSLVLRVLE